MIFQEKRKIKSGAKILVQFQKYSFIAKNGRYFFFLKTGMEDSLGIIIDRSKFQKKEGRMGKQIREFVQFTTSFCFYTTPKNIFVLQYGDLTEKKTKKQRWKYFFWNLSFFKEVCFAFFQRWREQSAVHFFLSFLEVVTAYICNRQKNFF